MRTALILVDLQNGFSDEFRPAELPVTGAGAAARATNAYLRDSYWRYDAVITTQDWHIDPGEHFAAEPDFASSWPAHCVAGTRGAELIPDLLVGLDNPVSLQVRKGQFTAAYSGFEGTVAGDAANGLLIGASLADALAHLGIDRVDLAGVATDHCVSATGNDALDTGLAVRVLVDLCAGVDPATTATALDRLTARGAAMIDAAAAVTDLPSLGAAQPA